MGAGINLFKQLFPSDFYPFTANSLMSSKPTGKKIVGKNLLDITAYRTLGDWSLTDGVLSANNNTYNPYCSETIKGTGKPTTISMNYHAENDRLYALQMYDIAEDNELFRHEFLQANNTYSQTFTLTEGKEYEVRIFGYSANSGSITIEDMMIEFGSTATAYEPYSETTIVYSGNELRGLLKVGTDGLYADGDMDDGSGSTAVRYEERAYQSGDESLTDAITDGTNTVVKLASPTTASSTAWSNPIKAAAGGTEEFTDSRTIKMPTGHDTIYSKKANYRYWG